MSRSVGRASGFRRGNFTSDLRPRSLVNQARPADFEISGQLVESDGRDPESGSGRLVRPWRVAALALAQARPRVAPAAC